MIKIFFFLSFFLFYLANTIFSFDLELSNNKGACVSSFKICKNGANCTKIGKYEFCKCLPGTFGDDCGIVADCIEEIINCNETHSNCGYNIRLEEAECICNDSDLKYDKNMEICRLKCWSSYDCLNGGTCRKTGNYHFCECLKGTVGSRCEIVSECEKKCSEESGAECRFNKTLEMAECLCKDGLKYDESTNTCRETCVFDSECQNGASCRMVRANSFCQCLPGTYGDECEEVTDCELNYVKCSKDSGTTCGYNSTYQIAECLCENGFLYDTITEKCTYACKYRECPTTTTCVSKGNDYYCKCKDGYILPKGVDEEENKGGCLTGHRCRRGDCPSATTVCVPKSYDDFYCECKEGYKLKEGRNEKTNKDNCILSNTTLEITTYSPTINPCNETSNPCPKISTECNSYKNDFFCGCKAGYKLQKAIEEQENKLPCIRMSCDCGVNSDGCHYTYTGFKNCSCKIGSAQNEGVCTRTCNYNDCLNDGKCEYKWNYYTHELNYFCDCTIGTSGDYCEVREYCDLDCEEKGGFCHQVNSSEKGFCVCPKSKFFNEITERCEERFEYTTFFFIVMSVSVAAMIVSSVVLLLVFIRFRRNVKK